MMRCAAHNQQPHPITGSIVVLTVAHLDHTPENCADDNLRAYCQRCHLAYDRDRHEANRKENKRRAQEEAGQLSMFNKPKDYPGA